MCHVLILRPGFTFDRSIERHTFDRSIERYTFDRSIERYTSDRSIERHTSGAGFGRLARWTGLEPATPGVTGRYSNQLSYHRKAFRARPNVLGVLRKPHGGVKRQTQDFCRNSPPKGLDPGFLRNAPHRMMTSVTLKDASCSVV